MQLWNHPETAQDVNDIFAGYCEGSIRALPFGDQPLSNETDCIKNQLIALNQAGYLTINSQPAVNAAPSNHHVFGWGPKAGYVYQKVC